MKHKFKVGDTVRHEEHGIGVIKFIDNNDIAVPYSVEFENKFKTGHDCDGLCKKGYGWWSCEGSLTLIAETPYHLTFKNACIVLQGANGFSLSTRKHYSPSAGNQMTKRLAKALGLEVRE